MFHEIKLLTSTIYLGHFKKGHSDKGHKEDKKGEEEEKKKKFFNEEGDEAHDEKKGIIMLCNFSVFTNYFYKMY